MIEAARMYHINVQRGIGSNDIETSKLLQRVVIDPNIYDLIEA